MLHKHLKNKIFLELFTHSEHLEMGKQKGTRCIWIMGVLVVRLLLVSVFMAYNPYSCSECSVALEADKWTVICLR